MLQKFSKKSANYLQMFCKSSAKVCQNFAKVLQKFSKNFQLAKILQNSSKVLQNFPKVLQNFPELLQILQSFYITSAKVLQKFISFFHIFIHDYASPGLNLFNLVVIEMLIIPNLSLQVMPQSIQNTYSESWTQTRITWSVGEKLW